MPNLISTFMPVATADDVISNLKDQITVLKPFKINLTDEVKRGSRTMGEGREGLARLVSNIASNNIDSLARENDPQELEDRLAYDAQLEKIRQMALGLLEITQETQLANSIDIMKMVDAFIANLQTSRSRNGSLDASMSEVDEYYKRYRNTASTVNTGDTPPQPVE
jgi:hypothetical protein